MLFYTIGKYLELEWTSSQYEILIKSNLCQYFLLYLTIICLVDLADY